jgi:hypothetical protein
MVPISLSYTTPRSHALQTKPFDVLPPAESGAGVLAYEPWTGAHDSCSNTLRFHLANYYRVKLFRFRLFPLLNDTRRLRRRHTRVDEGLEGTRTRRLWRSPPATTSSTGLMRRSLLGLSCPLGSRTSYRPAPPGSEGPYLRPAPRCSATTASPSPWRRLVGDGSRREARVATTHCCRLAAPCR